MSEPVLIALDWGISSLRAYLLDANGGVRDTLASEDGIARVPPGRFAEVFAARLAPWLQRHRDLSVIAGGMIGSRQGWLEAPYAASPAGEGEFAAALAGLRLDDGRAVRFVPGVVHHDASGVPDVMRGEEVQVIGALARRGAGDGLFVLPGTHSKWVTGKDGRIVRFSTYMTGELFELLVRHSILGRLMQDGDDAAAFDRGVRRGASGDAGSLLHSLFSVRSLPLLGLLPESGVRDYLSGLLIGSEVSAGLAAQAVEGGETPSDLLVIGAPGLTERYARAIRLLGARAETMAAEATVAGLWRIAVAADLIEEGRDVG